MANLQTHPPLKEPAVVYLVRHGETDYNKRRIVQGSGVDAPLNPTGRQQAWRFYEHFRHHPFDKVYISELRRTYESMEPFIRAKLPYERHAALNEISWGVHEGQPFDPARHREYLRVVSAWQSGETHRRIEGGESPEEVAARQRPFIELLIKRLRSGEEKHVLVCMHGRAMRIMLTQLLRYPLAYMDVFEHHNMAAYKLIFTGNLFRLEGYFLAGEERRN
jgi:probable phosphoglycerate mutase